jgi:hypothetical protein
MLVYFLINGKYIHKVVLIIDLLTTYLILPNQIMQAFYTAQNMDVVGDWTEHSVKRIATPEALSGRHKLAEILKKLGFKLL